MMDMDDLMFFRHFEYMEDEDPLSDRSTSSHDDDDDDDEDRPYWLDRLRGIQENDPDLKYLGGSGYNAEVQYLDNEDWEGLGRDISNNTILETVVLYDSALNDEKMSFLFREMRSSSISEMQLYENQLTVAGVRSMVPFLQNSNKLNDLRLEGNSLHSEGFNVLFCALQNSPVEFYLVLVAA